MINNEIYRVVNSIKANEKRMAKLAGLRDPREKAKGYVVAECQTLGIRLNKDDIIMAAVMVAEEAR